MAYQVPSRWRSRRSNTNRQKTARRNLVRAFRGASTTRAALRRNRIMSLSSSRQEMKLVDGLAATPGPNTLGLSQTPTVTCTNLIASGSGFNNRIGRKIDMTSLHLHGVLTQTGTATTVNDYVRICVVYDRQTNGTIPTFADMFTNYSQTSVTSTSAFSDLNPDERERYVILADWRMTLPATTTSGLNGSNDALQNSFNINRYIKLNLNTMYKGDTSPSVIGDIATGALFITTIGSLPAGSQGYNAVLSWRLRYKDN